jgi:uncharacterized protein with NRDE domain
MKAHWWTQYPHVLAGIDTGFKLPYSQKLNFNETVTVYSNQEHDHGTWIAISINGRYGFLTNYREPSNQIDPNALSRGNLVRDFVLGSQSPLEYIHFVKDSAKKYNGFNLVVGEVYGQSFFYGNRGNQDITEILDNIVYGLSNGTLISPWPKVEFGKRIFGNEIDNHPDPKELQNKLLQLLQNTTDFDELPPEMFDYELEKRLAPICIDKERIPTGT